MRSTSKYGEVCFLRVPYQRQPIVRRLPPLETNPQLIAKHCSLWSNVLHSRCETCEKVPLTSQPSPIIYRVRSWLLSDFV